MTIIKKKADQKHPFILRACPVVRMYAGKQRLFERDLEKVAQAIFFQLHPECLTTGDEGEQT